ncbi:MAG TPA: hypothetical protein VKG78_11565 [Opitutaceae bacterium]|nr:hypothetical protein [Opitutaceae bacterium]
MDKGQATNLAENASWFQGASALLAVGCAAWVAVEPLAGDSAILWDGSNFRTPISVWWALAALAVEATTLVVFLWLMAVATLNSPSSATGDTSPAACLLVLALLLLWPASSLEPAFEVLLVTAWPIAAVLVADLAVVGLMILLAWESEPDRSATPADWDPLGYTIGLLIASTLVWAVRRGPFSDVVNGAPGVFGLVAGAVRIGLIAAALPLSLDAARIVARWIIRPSGVPRRVPARWLGGACGLLMVVWIRLVATESDLVSRQKRMAVELRLESFARQAESLSARVGRVTEQEIIGGLEKLLDEFDQQRGRSDPADERRQRIASLLAKAWQGRLARERDDWPDEYRSWEEPPILASLDEATRWLGREPYAEIIASWAVGYERRLRGLGSGSLYDLQIASAHLPKRSRHLSPEQSASARAILVGHWRDRILGALEGDPKRGDDPVAAERVLGAADAAFPRIWAAEGSRLSAAWFPWCRAAARDEMEPDKVIVAMKVAAARDPAMKAKLVAEYVSGVAEHVRTLIGRGPAAADVEAALSRLEARPPSDWNEVISDSGMWHSGALSAL